MKLKEFRKDFDELRHKFSKTEIREYRKAFYDIKNYRNLSESEIKKVNKKFNKLKKKIIVILIVLIMVILIIIILPMMMNTEKLEVLEHYLKSLIVIITNQ